jgi:hypothetical protein
MAYADNLSILGRILPAIEEVQKDLDVTAGSVELQVNQGKKLRYYTIQDQARRYHICH